MRNSSFIITLLLAALAIPAYSQTIPEKYFSEGKSAAFAVNGFVDFSAANANQASAFEQRNLPDGFSNNHFSNENSIGNDTQIFLKSGVKTSNQAVHGAVAKVEFNYNSDKIKERPNLDQAFFFSEGNFGKFEFGNNQAVNQKMKAGPSRFVRGAGGINGKYLEHVNLPMLANPSLSSSPVCAGGVGSVACSNVRLPRFILLAQSPIGHGGGAKSFYGRTVDNAYFSASSSPYGAFNRSRFRALKDDSFDGVEDSTKLSYYSPRIAGLQLGFSYTPDSANNGVSTVNIYDLPITRIKNIFSFAANYSQDFDNLSVALSATGEKGSVQNSHSYNGFQQNDLMAYDTAFSLSYFGFTFGGSYGSWGKSLQAKNGIYSCDYNPSATLASQTCNSSAGQNFSNPYYYTLGLAYKFGPIGTSITGLKSTFQKNEYQAISLGLDYKLTKDFMPYFELTKFGFKSNQPKASDVANQNAMPSAQRQVKDNQGFVFLTGILFSF